MKTTQFRILVAVIALCLLLTACTQQPVESQTSEPQSAIAPNTAPATEPPNCQEIRLLSICSWDEYEKFEASLSDNTEFIRFEQLCKMGEFENLIFLSDAYNMSDYSSYMYHIVDGNGFCISLYIDPWEEDQVNTKKMLSMPDGTDFRKRNTSESGSITYGNMQYTYIKGELLSISWVQDGQEYTLTADNMLDEYPLDGGTLLNKLLSSKTAETALMSVGMQADSVN